MLHLFIVYLFTLGLFNVDLNCLIYVASDYSLINEQHNRPSSFNVPSHVPFVAFLSKLVIIWAASASVQEHGLSVKVKRVETWSG
jgi:hypothetical protein